VIPSRDGFRCGAYWLVVSMFELHSSNPERGTLRRRNLGPLLKRAAGRPSVSKRAKIRVGQLLTSTYDAVSRTQKAGSNLIESGRSRANWLSLTRPGLASLPARRLVMRLGQSTNDLVARISKTEKSQAETSTDVPHLLTLASGVHGSTEPGGRGHHPVGGSVKRAVDVAFSAVALAFLSPVMVCLGAAVRLADGGPATFGHTRIGYGRRKFKCYKFRTMVVDADARLAQHLADNPEAAEEWERTAKLRNDPRVTWAGHFLRKTSLDELPQLYNVLIGDMSMVGPRPVVERELAKYGAAADEYLAARPGITGLWQISGRNNLAYDDRVSLDAKYVNTWSMGGDVSIMLRTPRALFRFEQTS
jgi:exopolysaccharide production protein ExoY